MFKIISISTVLSVMISLLMNFISLAAAPYWFFSAAFHLLISVLLYLVLFRNTGDPRDYTFKIMFSSMGRLLLCMVGLLIYKVCDKGNFTHFAVHFMLHYILFTVFEIRYLLKFIKAPKND
jgi:hypothetical protein